MAELQFFMSYLGIVFLLGCGGLSPPRAESVLHSEWNKDNSPNRLSAQYKRVFSSLPREGTASKQAWPDSYWPNYRGGLADRWQDHDVTDGFSYELYTKNDVDQMSKAEIAKLSPAEKYSIFIDDFNFQFVQFERSRTSQADEHWFGLCHGWAAAAINFEEPGPVDLEGDNGIEVSFSSSDIKALLTYAQQYQRSPWSSRSLGVRCNDDSPVHSTGENSSCLDVNAGSFHIVVANQLGVLKQGFIADMTRSAQVWNHPIHGFSTEVIEESAEVYPHAAADTERIITIETKLKYTVESSPQHDKITGKEPFIYNRERLLQYHLEVDAGGEIIGGEWVTGERPDFLWTQTPVIFKGFFNHLSQIYAASIEQNR